MNGFHEEIAGIYRLKVPFERIYTSVFLIVHPQGNIMVDCASNASDVDNFIIPELEELGYSLSAISAIVLTHEHEDHAGGLSELLTINPALNVINTVTTVLPGIETVPLAGHLDDCIGVFDARSHTLISGDGLRGVGVDKYRCNIHNASAYLKTLERIEKNEKIENVLFSHAYEPWDQDHMFGRDNVLKCIADCKCCFNVKY